MDPSTASYYRAILFVDRTDDRKLPASLVTLHTWAVKRHQALGLGGVISKAVAMTVAMTWLSATEEGRAFSREHTQLGDLFGVSGEQEDEADDVLVNPEDWETLPPESDVLVTMKDKSTKVGKFVERRGSWVDVRIDGELKHIRISKVKIAG